MNRRSFIKTLGMGLFAAAAPEILLPSTRTIIDMMPRYPEIWAQQKDDLADLLRYLAPGGTLHVHNVGCGVSRTIYADRKHRLDIQNSRVWMNPRRSIVFAEDHGSGAPHTIINSRVDYWISPRNLDYSVVHILKGATLWTDALS